MKNQWLILLLLLLLLSSLPDQNIPMQRTKVTVMTVSDSDRGQLYQNTGYQVSNMVKKKNKVLVVCCFTLFQKVNKKKGSDPGHH